MSGVPYHAWTHRPKAQGGTDPIEVETGSFAPPFFRAYRWGAATQTITNTSDAYIKFDRYQTSDSSKIDIAGWQAGTPDTFNEISFKVRGLWATTIMVGLSAAGAFTGNFGIAFEGSTTEFYSAPFTSWLCTERAGDISSGQWSWTHIQSFPPIWREQTTDITSPSLKNLRFAFSNNAGSSVNIIEAECEIHLLYEFDYETAEGTIQSQA